MITVNGYKFTIDDKVSDLLANYDDEKYGPNKENIYKALELTSLDDVSVCILGQDPYPKYNDATGLAFSVNRDDKLPASLKNIYEELYNDLHIKKTTGCLDSWAKQGVLLLNTVFTVKYGQANSHHNLGWLNTSDQIIKQVSDRGGVVFVLLGRQAQSYEKLIDSTKNSIIKESHPSPLAVYRGFRGSKIFTKINNELKKYNRHVNWS